MQQPSNIHYRVKHVEKGAPSFNSLFVFFLLTFDFAAKQYCEFLLA